MQFKSTERIAFLDGLRGVAILLVVLYHTYSNAWKDLLPFFEPSYDFPLVKYGDLGVPLFFMISGFVITMSLERCACFSDFMFKRWLRLFPGMMIACVLIVLTANLFTSRPLEEVRLIDTINGITFISPSFYELFGLDQRMLEGGFWSLFVEVKFYIIAGSLYFLIGQKKMIHALIMIFLSYTCYDLTKTVLNQEFVSTFKVILQWLDGQYYGWFASGALFYRYFINREKAIFFAAVLTALLAARNWSGFMSGGMLAFAVIIATFACAMWSNRLQYVLSNQSLTFFGFISYPLYLIHENATISMIVQLKQQFSQTNVYILSLIPLAIMIVIAWAIAKYLEPWLRKYLKSAKNLLVTTKSSCIKLGASN